MSKRAGRSEERADRGSLLVWNGLVTRIHIFAPKQPKTTATPQPLDAKAVERGVRVP